ncbi:MAG: arginase family protein [Bacteroidetes bacterium]|nr:arginase family protein [Bacteroidota bacterium]
MKNIPSTLRLLYPQWQGGVISHWFPNLSPKDAATGYNLGARLLNFLAPENPNQTTAEVPVSLDYIDEEAEKGISRREAIIKQTQSALQIINQHNPDRIVTFGGECSASVVPFTFLSNKYPDDVAVVWIDAHPDINIPGDDYTGYHAMAVTACMGLGDAEIMDCLPTKIDASKVLLAGLCSLDKDAEKRLPELGIQHFSPNQLRTEPAPVLNWLKETGVSKVAIHFDLDVLDPKELSAAVDRESGQMKIEEVLHIIKQIAEQYDLVGLTIAEHLPDIEIKIRNILKELPLLK